MVGAGGELAAAGWWFGFWFFLFWVRVELPGCGGDAGFGVDGQGTGFSACGGAGLFSGPFGGEVVAGASGGGSLVDGCLLEAACGFQVLDGLGRFVLPCEPDGGR